MDCALQFQCVGLHAATRSVVYPLSWFLKGLCYIIAIMAQFYAPRLGILESHPSETSLVTKADRQAHTHSPKTQNLKSMSLIRVYVSVYCVHVYTYIYIYVYVHIHYLHTHTASSTHKHACVYLYAYIHT